MDVRLNSHIIDTLLSELDPAYLAIAVGLKWTKPPKDFLAQMLEFEKRIQAASALIWIAIYSIKYSFMFFFRKLVSRVRILGVWWWVVMAVVTLGGLASIPLAFIICSDFTMNYIGGCLP